MIEIENPSKEIVKLLEENKKLKMQGNYEKLRIKIWNYKNVVLFEIIYQDEELRNKGLLFKAKNGWKIESADTPQIYPSYKELYIRGQDNEEDYKAFAEEYNSTKEAKKAIREIQEAVKEFNESNNEILDNKEKEYLTNVIKPFKDKILYIEKREHLDEEYINIVIKGYDTTTFPNFKKGTMYKGMETYRSYTLEELGLND